MSRASFIDLVSHLLEAMGQRLDAARPIPEGLLLRTGDGFLYAFLDDPDRVSLEAVQRILAEAGEPARRLVVLTARRLPPALGAEILQHGGTLVETQRFADLVRQLGLESYLGEEPRAPFGGNRTRLLPSARQLDEIMGRARAWLDWGVPGLALRFYRQALALKPEYLPARSGIGRAFLALGLVDDADRTFQEVLAARPTDLDARLGQAGVFGTRGDSANEIALYRTLVKEDPRRVDVRAHLVAALIAANDWASARSELEGILEHAPEDPQIRFLYAVALEKTGANRAAESERKRARQLGLAHERERILSEHVGVPLPAAPETAAIEPIVTPDDPPDRGPSPGVTDGKPVARKRPKRRTRVSESKTVRKAK